MVDGTAQDSKRSITVEVKMGDKSFNLELLVVRRSVDHLTLGMDCLAKKGAVLTIAGNSVKLGSKISTPTATAAAKGTRASAVSKISPTSDPTAISSSMHAQAKTLERTAAVRTARTTPLATGYIVAKAATSRSDIPRLKCVTQENVRDVTARSARAFRDLQSVTTRQSRSQHPGKRTRTKRTRRPKQAKTTPITLKIIGLCLHPRPKQGKFNKLASPSPNIFYVSSTNMERTSDAAK
uniref:Uncharacterized protein n=1 Tax=Glossina palpalis gambiensis TaxID=67801 RepID=A0A1B0AL44_9MUSC